MSRFECVLGGFVDLCMLRSAFAPCGGFFGVLAWACGTLKGLLRLGVGYLADFKVT